MAKNAFLSSIAAHRLLGREEERELLIRAKAAGDPVAEQLLVKFNIRLVICQAQKFCSPDDARMPDLIQSGITGLIIAIKRFDIRQENRFSTYAVWWILAEIRKEIALLNPRITKHKATMQKFKAELLRLTEECEGNTPSRNAVILSLGWGPKEEQQLQIAESAQIISLDKIAPSLASGSIECDAITGADISDDCASRLDLDDLRKRLDVALEDLPPNWERIVRNHYGYGSETTETYEEIRRWHGGTRERIRQLENRALRELWGKLKDIQPDK
jgi:RNA polymerase primary sigma factor